eukprot:CAMPEP_0114490484 /NCGR_PEP_ID=MMETSP0109-20121206/2469_1 /TAXON_ID=29199 /ORGANISM="Chlorarachnion reptans, Strain CCCM449" /LENGTH=885 /DNA_ID=CAMNT_0001667109 /DNA_START=18 /DNA_END=2672 /DNA_ORIENTATION=+
MSDGRDFPDKQQNRPNNGIAAGDPNTSRLTTLPNIKLDRSRDQPLGAGNLMTIGSKNAAPKVSRTPLLHSTVKTERPSSSNTLSKNRKRKKKVLKKEIFTCPFGQCNHKLQGGIGCTLSPDKKCNSFRLKPHDCEYMHRPTMLDSWGIGKKIRCPACDSPIQLISQAEPQRFNMTIFVNHLLSHYDESSRSTVYPKVVQELKNSNLSIKTIYTQICTAYLALVWPRMFNFQAGVKYPFAWPERLKNKRETLQDINIITKFKKGEGDPNNDLDTIMKSFKEQNFKDAKAFNYEKKASVIKFVLSYEKDFDNLDHRFEISKKIQSVISKLRSENPDFMVYIEDRGMRRGSIQAILLCYHRNEKESDFMNFLRVEMPRRAEYKGEKPQIFLLDYKDNLKPIPDPKDQEENSILEPIQESKDEENPENPRQESERSWSWYTALQEEGDVYTWKKELKELQEYICENKREVPTDLATADLLGNKCTVNKRNDKIKGPYSYFKGSGGWMKHPGAVLIQLDVRGISNVEVDNGTFDMSAYIRVVFYDPNATKILPIGDGKNTYEQIYGNKSDAELKGYCVPPLIRTRNAVEGDALHEGWGMKAPRMFSPSNHKGIWIQELFLKNIKFHESFQLDDFPFDTQTCAVIFALVHTRNNRSHFNFGGVFKEQKVQPPQFLLPWLGQMKMRAPLKGYQLCTPEVRTYNNLLFENGSRSNQLLIHRTSIRRKYDWYVYDLMLPLGFTGTVSFMTFLMNKTDHRITFNVTLLVIIAAFKRLITTQGPRSPETVTIIDRYCTYNFYLVLIIMCGTTVIACLPSLEEKESFLLNNERALGIVLLMVWIIGHLITCARVIETSNRIAGKSMQQVLLSASPKTRNDINEASDTSTPLMKGLNW